jgi:hypothetical protein
MSDNNGWRELCRQFRKTTEDNFMRLEHQDETQDKHYSELEKRLRIVEKLLAAGMVKIGALVTVAVTVLTILIKYIIDKIFK